MAADRITKKDGFNWRENAETDFCNLKAAMTGSNPRFVPLLARIFGRNRKVVTWVESGTNVAKHPIAYFSQVLTLLAQRNSV